MKSSRITRFMLLGMVVLAVFACSREKKKAETPVNASEQSSELTVETKSPVSIAVFIPGVVAGSPTYEALVEGVERAAEEDESVGVTVQVVEGGFNQDQWADSVMSLAATGQHDCIVTTNPALPAICKQVSERFPDQRFVVLDGYLEGHPAIYTLLYNQMEQSYLIGHLAGLITTHTSNELEGANDALKIGLIAGQEYPIMNRVIRVGYEMGAKSVNVDVELDFRVLGNWYDASKAGNLASIMYDSGVDVILAIAGGANQGILTEAEGRGKYVLWYDSNGYGEAEGVVLGSSALEQERAAYEKTLEILSNTVEYGTAEIRGVIDGFVTFIEDDPLYERYVPETIRAAQRSAVESIRSGKLQLTMPGL